MFTLNRLLAGVLTVAATLTTTAATVSAEPTRLRAYDSVAAAPVRIMPLGDSITDGVGAPGGYRVGLRQKLVADGRSIDFVGSVASGPGSDREHEGHSGWTIGQIHNNIVNWLRTYTPSTILLHIGTNDMYGSDPNGAPQRLSALIDRITAQSPNADLFVATIIPIRFADPTVRRYNASLTTIVKNKAAQGKRVHLVDMYPAVPMADLPDGIHPNAAGYGKMATTWFNALRAVPGSIGGVAGVRNAA